MLQTYVTTYANLHLKSIVSRKVSVFGGIEMRNIISCYYFASNPSFLSFSFSQLINNEKQTFVYAQTWLFAYLYLAATSIKQPQSRSPRVAA